MPNTPEYDRQRALEKTLRAQGMPDEAIETILWMDNALHAQQRSVEDAEPVEPKRTRRASIPDNVTPDTMLRLEAAAALGFPDGSMSAGRAAARSTAGRLAIYPIAGKDYTTLNDIAGDEKHMPRPAKGPRLALFKAKGRTTVWNIRDGQRTIGTGCVEGDRAAAEKKLAAYITGKHDPRASRSGGDPNAIKIADALSVYMHEKIAHSARPKAGIAMVEKLGDFFGERTIGELNGQLQRDYAKQRRSQSAARRELETVGGGDQLSRQGHGRRRADAIPSDLARCSSQRASGG